MATDLFSSVSLCKFMYILSYDIFTSTSQNLKFECSKSVLKSNKMGGNDGLVGEFFKYGEKRMANLLIVLYEVVWIRESISKHRRQGLIISFYRKVM